MLTSMTDADATAANDENGDPCDDEQDIDLSCFSEWSATVPREKQAAGDFILSVFFGTLGTVVFLTLALTFICWWRKRWRRERMLMNLMTKQAETDAEQGDAKGKERHTRRVPTH